MASRDTSGKDPLNSRRSEQQRDVRHHDGSLRTRPIPKSGKRSKTGDWSHKTLYLVVPVPGFCLNPSRMNRRNPRGGGFG